MKIIQILPELNSGGVERGTLEVAEHLVRHGHTSIVISHGGRQVEALEKAGSMHVTLPVHRKHPVSLAQVLALRRFFAEERPDIVHARSRVPAWVAWLALKTMDAKTRPHFITTVHGFYSINVYSAIMTRGERVIAVSDSVREYALTNYRNTRPETVTTIHRGVSPDLYHPAYRAAPDWLAEWKARHPKAEGKVVLLLPARLTRWKGQIDFLQVISDLRRAGVNVHGLIVGEAHPKKREFEQELKDLARTMGVDDHVEFLGHRQDLREIMTVSDFVLSLSKDPEAFGRVTLEAMALGRPVIAYDHGGVGEQLRAHFPAGAVTCDDVAAVTARVQSLLADPQTPAPLQPGFTLGHMLDATLAIYRSVAG
jgi:glycosyltransferase involved in cell wall biosynthesis